MRYSIPYNKRSMYFEIPEEFNITIVNPNSKSTVKNIATATKESLSHPINSKKLSEIAKEKSTACIVVTDITRSCPEKELLPTILEEIEKEINRKDITLLIASGMHREMSYDEKIEKYGKDIVDNYRIVDHNAKDQKTLVDLGITKNGTPIRTSRIAAESELLVSLGVVEPHQYAGYSGGYKTVSIGVSGDETISHTHSPKIVNDARTRVGNVKGNSFQEDMIEIGKKVGLDFIVNVILGKEKEILEIRAGEPMETHRMLIKDAKALYEVPVKKSFDVIVCGVGFPKDVNLYQTSRAASYVFYAPTQVVRNGGYIIIPAGCQEGAGTGVGEQRFFSLLKNNSLDEILSKNDEFRAGEQRAFVMANVLKHCKVIIVGSYMPQVVTDAKMIAAKDMEEAFGIVKNDFGSNVDLLVIPNSLITLPIIQ